MPKPYASGVVSGSADAVWEVARKFDGLPSWHSGIVASELTSGLEGQVEAIRKLTLAGGAVVTERLVGLDEEDRS